MSRRSASDDGTVLLDTRGAEDARRGVPHVKMRAWLEEFLPPHAGGTLITSGRRTQ